ncbi:MAG: RDD family protein [Anaerolineae bacterium]
MLATGGRGWWRASSTTCCYIIFLVPTWFASAVAGDGQNLILSAVAMGLLIVAVPSAIAYALFADGLPGGQSIGKRILAIRVVDEATGAPCTYRQSFIRNLVLSIGSFIDALFIFGARRQRLGDLAARTIVTNVPGRGAVS